ncbi:MAG: DUF2339 domain-containing protein [Paracoccaceae bacterium]
MMDDLLISLAILAAFGLPITVIVLVFAHFGLRRRVRALEERLAGVAPEAPSSPIAAPNATAEDSAAPEEAEAGPWAAARSADPAGGAAEPIAPEPVEPAEPPKPRGPSAVTRLAGWVKENWVYSVSAVSLALAGIFLVQYGVEQGLLPPAARVALALLFGAALIGAGEWLRRRFGDSEDSTTAYLPSVFSGAGIVALFAGVLSARLLYGLVGAETAFAGLVVVAGLAVLLGWFYGPLLAAVGLLGAAGAPFAVDGGGAVAPWLFAYEALVAIAGLLVDAGRRWRWVSILSLVLGFGTGWLLYVASASGSGGALWFAGLGFVLALAAIAAPVFSLTPRHGGPGLGAMLRRGGWKARPDFTVLLALAATALAALLTLLPTGDAAESTALFGLAALLAAVLILWTDRARALTLLPVLPAAAYLIRLVNEADGWGPLAAGFFEAAERGPEVAAPMTATLLLAMAVPATLAAAWRSLGASPAYRPWWSAGAALFAPLAAVTLEFFWAPARIMGAYPWALNVMALAALMVVMAGWFARADGPDRRRAAHATLSALSLIALALFILLSQAALTLALGALLIVAALLDRRFRLPEMEWFLYAGVVVLGYRLVVDPGLGWGEAAPLDAFLAAYAGAPLATAAAWWLIRPLGRVRAPVALESAAALFVGLFVNLALARWIRSVAGYDDVMSHWSLSLSAMTWAGVALVQLYRRRLGGPLNILRTALAVLAGLAATAALAASVLVANPLNGWAPKVHGPLIADTMLVAYGLPALLFWQASRRVPGLNRWLRHGLAGLAGALGVFYVALEIRRFWQGEAMASAHVGEGELYSYTVALLILGAALLWQAIARRSTPLRRLAMAVIALTVAKVFLIDASGLAGLVRVFSFLALGLSLAGLAWLNRWAAGQSASPPAPDKT